MNLGRLAVRSIIGGYFVAHGTQKLFGWFDGGGIDGTAAMFEQIGMRPGKPNAVLAGVTEAGGGAALLLGTGAPLAHAGLIATMVTAIRKVHIGNGPFVTKQGYEYNLVLIGALLALADEGAGDPALEDSGQGTGGALLALGLGVAGSFLAEAVGQRIAGPAADPADDSSVADAVSAHTD